MPTFLWSGKTASGQEEVERIDAATAAEARQMLEARGWTSLRQHTTEIHDFVQQQIAQTLPPERQPKLTPRQELAFLQGTAPGMWRKWLKSIRESAGVLLVLAACAAWEIYRHRLVMAILALALMALLVCLFPVLHWWFGRTKDAFVKLHTARNWRRWDEVLKYLDQLQSLRRSTKISISEVEMARYRALALAGLGRLDEAVNGLRAAAEKARTPAWLLQTHLAGLYNVAGQYDRGLAAYRQALQAATDNSTVCLDLGIFLVQRFNRPDEAKLLLAQAESAQLAELAQVYVPYLRGAIALRESNFAAVDQNIREALAGFEKFASKKFYIFEPSVLICKGYLALSCAALGRKDEAKKYFAQSQPYLTTIGLDEFLEKYRALSG